MDIEEIKVSEKDRLEFMNSIFDDDVTAKQVLTNLTPISNYLININQSVYLNKNWNSNLELLKEKEKLIKSRNTKIDKYNENNSSINTIFKELKTYVGKSLKFKIEIEDWKKKIDNQDGKKILIEKKETSATEKKVHDKINVNNEVNIKKNMININVNKEDNFKKDTEHIIKKEDHIKKEGESINPNEEDNIKKNMININVNKEDNIKKEGESINPNEEGNIKKNMININVNKEDNFLKVKEQIIFKKEKKMFNAKEESNFKEDIKNIVSEDKTNINVDELLYNFKSKIGTFFKNFKKTDNKSNTKSLIFYYNKRILELKNEKKNEYLLILKSLTNKEKKFK